MFISPVCSKFCSLNLCCLLCAAENNSITADGCLLVQSSISNEQDMLLELQYDHGHVIVESQCLHNDEYFLIALW